MREGVCRRWCFCGSVGEEDGFIFRRNRIDIVLGGSLHGAGTIRADERSDFPDLLDEFAPLLARDPGDGVAWQLKFGQGDDNLPVGDFGPSPAIT